jgi:ribosomal-protein-alanine N-acetyltransferase
VTASEKAGSDAVWIRPMNAADLGRILLIAEELPDAPHWTDSAYSEAIDPDHRPLRVALVAADAQAGAQANAAIGFVVASLVAPEAELETIAVRAGAQRRGVASQLIARLVEVLRGIQVTELRLEVRASNLAAIGFYRARGFSEVGRRPRYYADPEEDAVLMALWLG